MNGLNPCSSGRYTLTTNAEMVIRDDNCLNPCSSGRYTLTNRWTISTWFFYKSLNPCSSGRYTLTARKDGIYKKLRVLILVLAVDILWHIFSLKNAKKARWVLILVLAVDILWHLYELPAGADLCLNPCSSGRYTLTSQ